MKEISVKSLEACKEIIDIIQDHYEMDIVNDKSRKHPKMLVKHIARYLVRKYCVRMSLESIASEFGLDEHGTIINSVRVVNDAIDVNDIEIVDILNFFTLKIESESEAVKSLLDVTAKAKYNRRIFSLLHDFKPNQLKDLVSIIKNYKHAYNNIESVVENPLQVIEA